ncbi:hypothetical protein HMN09_00894800 [Mycena chlorophos]|uniref:Uncharacterized protein n=1 Tax=Mycena chlorophos TaxID=658473 RepID=A0A8H6SP51_MYCCL|nr:hypothetical protein HMN09_00894800 [Mycena chlorophos]
MLSPDEEDQLVEFIKATLIANGVDLKALENGYGPPEDVIGGDWPGPPFPHRITPVPNADVDLLIWAGGETQRMGRFTYYFVRRGTLERLGRERHHKMQVFHLTYSPHAPWTKTGGMRSTTEYPGWTLKIVPPSGLPFFYTFPSFEDIQRPEIKKEEEEIKLV